MPEINLDNTIGRNIQAEVSRVSRHNKKTADLRIQAGVGAATTHHRVVVLRLFHMRLWFSWQRQDRLKPTARMVSQQDVATVHLGNVARNTQAQTGAASIAAA